MNRKKMLHSGLFLLAAYTLVGSISLLAGEDKNPTTTEAVGPDAARLWAQNCQQCHNLRPATAYSDNQLQLIVHHMRTRSHITGQEQRAILAFLQEAN